MQLIFSKVESSRAEVDNSPEVSIFPLLITNEVWIFQFLLHLYFHQEVFHSIHEEEQAKLSVLQNRNILVKDFNTLDRQDLGDLMWKEHN